MKEKTYLVFRDGKDSSTITVIKAENARIDNSGGERVKSDILGEKEITVGRVRNSL